MAGGNLTADETTLFMGAHLLSVAIFAMLMIYGGIAVATPLNQIRVSPLYARLHWCVKVNVYICFMSCMFNILELTDMQAQFQSMIGHKSAVIKPLEYLFTCPLMMLSLVVMAGERVPLRRYMEVTGLTSIVLVLGFFASLSFRMEMKLMCFSVACTCFLVLIQRLAVTVSEHSEKQESLFKMSLGGSVYRKLCLKTVVTWLLFPVWWVFSAEGIGIYKDVQTNVIVTTVINIVAKALFILYVHKVYNCYVGEYDLMQHPAEKSVESREVLDHAARCGAKEALRARYNVIEKERRAIEKLEKLIGLEDGAMKKPEHCPTPTGLVPTGPWDAKDIGEFVRTSASLGHMEPAETRHPQAAPDYSVHGTGQVYQPFPQQPRTGTDESIRSDPSSTGERRGVRRSSMVCINGQQLRL